MEIRKATTEDLEALVQLRLEMRRERETTSLAIPEEEFAESLRAFFAKGLKDGSFVSYLAIDEGHAVACSGLSFMALPPTYSAPYGTRGYVTNMYTRGEWRRRGIAARLLDALVDHARRAGCCEICLNASPAGRKLYLEYGFAEYPGEMKLSIHA